MVRYRLSATAQADVIAILAWTQEQFVEAAPLRYESLIAAALRDVATQAVRPGSVERPELGAGVRSWHLRLSRESEAPVQLRSESDSPQADAAQLRRGFAVA